MSYNYEFTSENDQTLAKNGWIKGGLFDFNDDIEKAKGNHKINEYNRKGYPVILGMTDDIRIQVFYKMSRS